MSCKSFTCPYVADRIERASALEAERDDMRERVKALEGKLDEERGGGARAAAAEERGAAAVGASTRPPLTSSSAVSVIETTQQPNISHKRWSRQAEKWRSVSPWAMAREVERLAADVGAFRLQLDAAEQAAQLAR
jgi:hypothetical protein